VLYPKKHDEDLAATSQRSLFSSTHYKGLVLSAQAVLDGAELFQTGTHVSVVRMLAKELAQDFDCGRVVLDQRIPVREIRLRLYRCWVPLGRVPKKRQRLLRESPRVKQTKSQPFQVNLTLIAHILLGAIKARIGAIIRP
jgi:hypothetical protein